MRFKKRHSFSKLHLIILWISITLLLQSLPLSIAEKPLGNPYKILGVSRRATLQEIRKAYKQLVKEWHPDKTDHPEAQQKFVEITKAYELLSDPERRRNFDNHGITEENLNRDKRSSESYNMHDPFEEFFAGNLKFRYQSRDISVFHRMSVTYRAYENTMVPKSYREPYLILFYSDWCFACLQMEPTWKDLVHDLEPLGVNLVTVHAEKEHALSRKLSIHTLPTLGVLVEGKISYYKEEIITIQKVVEFIRSRFPYRLFTLINNNNNLHSFLSGCTDNRIRAVLFENKESPRLRYLLTALYYKDRVAFGFVQNDKVENAEILSKFKIQRDQDTLLLFNENWEKPIASITQKAIPPNLMHEIIDANQFLILPRLSNQVVMDAVCPIQWKRSLKRICVILISQNNPTHDAAVNKFRKIAEVSPYKIAKVRYAYMFKEYQAEFLSALTVGETSPQDPLLHIVIIWRRDSNRLEYEWFSQNWSGVTHNDTQWNKTRESLEHRIGKLIRTSQNLLYVAEVKDLKDEHALKIIDKMINKIIFAFDYVLERMTRDQILTFLSILGTVLLIATAGYGMAYLVKLEEASVRARQSKFDNSKSTSTTPELRLHEMRIEKYNALVRLLKPGCRTIILLVDSQSKLKLLPAFHKAVWPYRKNKTLMFAHLSLERGLDWYKKILSLSLPEPRELNINAKNCVGTVLSLNGHRKYFCMYHAKHPECRKGKKNSQRLEKMTRKLTKVQDPEAGAFIGFDEYSSDSDLSQDESDPTVLYQENLLDGLPLWLDRLFEGSTQRYYINYWPDFTAK